MSILGRLQISNFLRRPDIPPVTNLAVNLSPHMTCCGIAQALQNKHPFLVSRLGWFETYAVGYWDTHKQLNPALLDKMWNTPGIFPAKNEQFRQFHHEYTCAASSIDIIGLMRCPYEKEVVTRYAQQALRCELGDLEPYYHPVPWSRYLEGLRVLVVSPFVDTIKSQYQGAREKLFIDEAVLPEFSLLTLKSPQTMCGNTDGYASWTEALDRLKCSALTMECDVAIVGCGAYGLPLGAYLKNAGKVCIHLGGATQTLFGVTGRRWEVDRNPMKLFTNKFWVRPSKAERPSNWHDAEEGCYW